MNDVIVGDTVTYSLAFSGPAGHNIWLFDPLPEGLVYVPGSVTPPAIYSPTIPAIIWQGTLPTDTLQAISFQVTLTNSGNLSSTMPLIVNTAWLTDTEYEKNIQTWNLVNGWNVYFPSISR